MRGVEMGLGKGGLLLLLLGVVGLGRGNGSVGGGVGVGVGEDGEGGDGRGRGGSGVHDGASGSSTVDGEGVLAEGLHGSSGGDGNVVGVVSGLGGELGGRELLLGSDLLWVLLDEVVDLVRSSAHPSCAVSCMRRRGRRASMERVTHHVLNVGGSSGVGGLFGGDRGLGGGLEVVQDVEVGPGVCGVEHAHFSFFHVQALDLVEERFCLFCARYSEFDCCVVPVLLV